MSASRSRTLSLILPVYVPSLLLSAGQGILVPTLPLFAQDRFEVNFSLVSLVVAAAGLGTLISDVPAGMLIERWGRKPVMIAGTFAAAVATMLMGTAAPLAAVTGIFPAYVALVCLRLVAGGGSAMWNISRMAYIADVVPIADRGRALSTFGGVGRIGTFVGPFVGGLIGTWFGLEASFYVAGGLSLIGAAISIFTIHESRQATGRAGKHMQWALVGTVARRHWRDLTAAGSAQVFAQMIRAGRQLIVPLYASNTLGLSVAEIGSIVSISSAVDMSLFLPAGILMDKLGRKFASVPSFIVLAIGMAMVPFTVDYATLLIATCVMGFGNGIGSGTMMTLGADLAPREATGEFLGVWRLIGDAGTSGGPMAVGAIADLIGLGPAAFCLSATGILAASTLVVFVRETLGNPVAPVRINAPPSPVPPA
ncbi:MAG: MFS transporter [Chloroflexota bacterium]